MKEVPGSKHVHRTHTPHTVATVAFLPLSCTSGKKWSWPVAPLLFNSLNNTQMTKLAFQQGIIGDWGSECINHQLEVSTWSASKKQLSKRSKLKISIRGPFPSSALPGRIQGRSLNGKLSCKRFMRKARKRRRGTLPTAMQPGLWLEGGRAGCGSEEIQIKVQSKPQPAQKVPKWRLMDPTALRKSYWSSMK